MREGYKIINNQFGFEKADNCMLLYNFKESNEVENMSYNYEKSKELITDELIGIWKIKTLKQ